MSQAIDLWRQLSLRSHIKRAPHGFFAPPQLVCDPVVVNLDMQSPEPAGSGQPPIPFHPKPRRAYCCEPGAPFWRIAIMRASDAASTACRAKSVMPL